jgi:membrane-bound serine protease (ClpP class)
LEHVVLSHGGLTAGGVTLLVLGALWLVDPARAPGLGVSPIAISGTALLLIAAVAGLVTLAVRVRGRPPATGPQALVGQIAEVRRAIDPEGMVYVGGALWSAWSDEGPLPVGELVEVAGIENLRLYVRRLDREPSSLNV